MKFSVIIPAYNAEIFIQRSIRSVLSQTFSDFEVIVINDGSKDTTYEKAVSITDERLVVINKTNEGVSAARNTGIQAARGEYICFLDADDEYLPEHLAVLADNIEEYKDKDFFSTRFCISMMNDSANIDMPAVTGKTDYYDNVVERTLHFSELIWTGCVCIRKAMFDEYGMFAPGIKLGEDTDMWKRIYVHTGLVAIDTVTVKRNRDGSEATKQYTRSFEVDPLNRMSMFLNDNTITDSVKESLKTEYELQKLSVVRSYLFSGDKKKAKEQMKLLNRERISRKRLFVTQLCFVIPSFIIRRIIRFRNRGLYE